MTPSMLGSHPLRTDPPVSGMEEVKERIREYVANNNLAPGERLPGEEWFAQQLRIGRPLVREAMRGLEAVGVLEARRGSGRYVGAFDPAAYMQHVTTEVLVQSFSERELMEARCLLEIAMVVDALHRLTDEDLEDVRQVVSAMRMRVENGEPYAAEDIEMHRIILRRSDNRFISVMLDAMYTLSQARGGSGASIERRREDLAEHEAIAEAIVARDGQATRARLMDHFDTTAGRLGFEPRWRELFAELNTTGSQKGSQ